MVNILIILNIFILEVLLSIDNATVLAIMVKDLPTKQQGKALKYGIFGAFAFRGLCLFVASWLIKILWLKIAGGIYLIYLVYKHSKDKNESEDTSDNDTNINKDKNKFYSFIKNTIGIFWATVVLVEIMDIAFSIDNIFAVVAMSDKFWFIIIGVCIGIIAMRFVAQGFTVLMKKFPSLESSAFIVIFILGLKLILSGITDYFTSMKAIKTFMSGHSFDIIFSGVMMLIFLFPLLKKIIKK